VNADLAAEALFVSPLQPSTQPGPADVDAAVIAAILLHGSCGCAGMVAQEFGDHPDLAAARMRWAAATVHNLFQPAPV
jgi:hypothetical protein